LRQRHLQVDPSEKCPVGNVSRQPATAPHTAKVRIANYSLAALRIEQRRAAPQINYREGEFARRIETPGQPEHPVNPNRSTQLATQGGIRIKHDCLSSKSSFELRVHLLENQYELSPDSTTRPILSNGVTLQP